MRILFVHQNFPAQYRHLAAAVGRTHRWKAKALGDARLVGSRAAIPGVEIVGYDSPAPSTPSTHHYVRSLEAAVRRGQAVVRACIALKKRGFVPDVIYAHPGWGEALFLRDVFPDARLTLYCEFFYRARGADVGFDPEFPTTLDDTLRVRIKNAAGVISMEAADAGISPTRWQRNAFPEWFRSRISLAHEGVDTDLLAPRADATLEIPGAGITLSARDEVVTYVARNLEPYRGFHAFMRAVPDIQRRRPRAHVVIVGATGVSYGKPLPAGKSYKGRMLDELAGRIDLSRVHFLGTVPYRTLLDVYHVSGAHVYLTYPFVLSWSLLEAMAAGCAVVGSKTAPVEEIIEDGANGFLVDFFDSPAIAERVDHALSRRPEVLHVRECARRTVVDRYDLRRICLPAHLELLEAAVQRPQVLGGERSAVGRS